MQPGNQTNQEMPQTEGAKSDLPAYQPPDRPELKTRVRSSKFKYYIHDGVDACRMQLLGEVSEAEVNELNGCWTTAKTSLADRKMVLDLRSLTKMDEAGHQWIIWMANAGAVLVPETFLADRLAGNLEPLPELPRPGFLSRMLGLVRGSRNLAAHSTTQAQ